MKADNEPIPFDEALKRMLEAPPPKKPAKKPSKPKDTKEPHK